MVRLSIVTNISYDKMRDYSFHGKENKATAEHLKNGETCIVTGIGNSMTPILKSHQDVICKPVTEDTELHKRDIVLSKVNGHYYLHLIHAIKNDSQYLIGNNHGRMNGWVNKSNVFGKVVEIL
jgi:hypothetical protein